MKKVFFPGSFNPFTKGHADIIERMLKLADKVVIGVGYNSRKPDAEETVAQRTAAIQQLYDRPEYGSRVEVIAYADLTMNTARSIGADCVVRGVRNATDFDYEYSLAAANRKVFGIETILLPADPELGFISSTVVRDLISYGSPELAGEFLPDNDFQNSKKQ